jgi:hypothetical protein
MKGKEDIPLTEKGSLSKEAFLRIAENSGLDADAPHFEDLYAYLNSLRPTLKAIENLDLAGLEPFMPSLREKE